MKINGVVVKEMGVDVAEGDVVEVNGSVINAEHKNVYVAVNKPLGYITSMEDDKGRACLLYTSIQINAKYTYAGKDTEVLL